MANLEQIANSIMDRSIYLVPGYKKEGDYTDGLSYAEDLIRTEVLTKKYNCFILGEEICLACMSGRYLLRFDELTNRIQWMNFYFVSMHDYSQEDIYRFKRNAGLRIGILLPDRKTLGQWTGLRKVQDNEHPLLGIIMIIDNEGKIRFATKKWDTYNRWLGRYKNEKEGN